MMNTPLEICVLAAGKGTRMKTLVPKMLQPIAGAPMITHVVSTARALKATKTHLVVSEDHGGLKSAIEDQGDLNWVVQSEQLGTGHAVQQAAPFINADAAVLVLLGDVPLLAPETLQPLLADPADVVVLTVNLQNPAGYGRIQRNAEGQVLGIVEDKDATAAERLITEINTGIFRIKPGLLPGLLAQLSNDNRQGEFYLTDVVSIAVNQGLTVASVTTDQAEAVSGVNDLVQLATAERFFQRRQAEQLMRAGVRMLDPARVDIRGAVSFGHDVVLDVNTVLEGPCEIGHGVVIEAGSVIKNSVVGDNSLIKSHSSLEGASLAQDCQVGPYARLRPGAVLSAGVAIGNFVEVKQTTMGPGSKASHLSYLGDATIGAQVNIGAGTITCNYDGVNKWQTILEDEVFVGSNTALVAPVTVGQGATIGAGSTITGIIPDAALGVARGRQRNIEAWPRPEKVLDAPGLVKKLVKPKAGD
jgi:bifunctional UDP-N-acetylglucosamine pyrophosphorylase/glucosamine-1-phosphate N-acetyltransferase